MEAEEFQRKISDLTRSVQSLSATTSDLLAMRSEDRQEVDRVERRTARTTTGLVLGILGILLVMLIALGVNRVTLQQAQREAQADLTFQIVNCFLRPGSNTPAQVEECARRNGGALYAQRQKESAEAVKRFVDLQRWAVQNGWTPPETPKE